MSYHKEEQDIYYIPPNFLTSGRLFGGMIRVRNAIEACVLVLLTGLPIIRLPLSLTARIILLCLIPLPLGIFAVIGFDGDSLTEFALNWIKWLFNRRILYAKYSYILDKIDRRCDPEKLFKATQGIVENPSCLNKKNIATVESTGVDVSNFNPGDEVFVISADRIDDLHLTEKEKTFLREYHEPNEVNRYACQKTFSKYLLYLCKDNMPDVTVYPNIYNHLVRYKPFMDLRRETQKGSIQWFQLHWPRKEALFAGTKVVYPQMGAKPTFAYANFPFYTNMSANIIYSESNIDLKVLTCVLNSKLAHFWFLHRAKNRGVGLDIAVSVVDKFPVDRIILSDNRLRDLAEQAITAAYSGEDFSSIDHEIDDCRSLHSFNAMAY